MIKSFLASTLVLLCTSLTESTILSNIQILPCIPDLSLICVLYFSLHNGKLPGETTGFISGLFLDFMSAGPFGLNCLFRTVIGFIGGLFNKVLNTEGFFIPALLGFCATLLKAALLWLISFIYPSPHLAYSPISWMFLFELGMNTLLTPIMFKFLSLFKNAIVLSPETIR